jgi:hypothetical protein
VRGRGCWPQCWARCGPRRRRRGGGASCTVACGSPEAARDCGIPIRATPVSRPDTPTRAATPPPPSPAAAAASTGLSSPLPQPILRSPSESNSALHKPGLPGRTSNITSVRELPICMQWYFALAVVWCSAGGLHAS